MIFMKVILRFIAVSCAAFASLIFLWNEFEPKSFSQQVPPENLSAKAFAEREKAYRFNNIGVALLDQFNHADAVESFRNALKSDPNLKPAQINLAIALFYVPDLDAALTQAQKAREIAPESPQPVYILGLIAKTQNRTDEAIVGFKRILEIDPRDVGASVNLAQIYIQQQKYKEAVSTLRPALEAEPYNTTTVYNLATALLRIGEREEGQLLMKRFQELRRSGAGTSIGQNYLEQGRFAEALTSTGAETDLVEKAAPEVVFQNEDIGLAVSGQKKTSSLNMPDTPFSNANESGAALFDFDGDGDLDLAELAKGSTNLYLFRNDAGKFIDVSKVSGDLSKPLDAPAMGIVAGDYDGDVLTDLLVFGRGQPQIFRNTGGKFQNATIDSKIPMSTLISISGAFVDADHDGDLDILLGGFAPVSAEKTAELPPNQLLRNNGNGTFTDISDTAKINAPSRAVAVVPTDFDNRRDVDFLILNYGGAPQLWQNLRDGSFRNVAKDVGLDKGDNWTSAAVGDFNKDSFSDFFFGRQGGAGVFAISDGRGKFTIKDAPTGTENASAAQFLDFDNDGLLDLIAQTDKGFVLTRNLGSDWTKADSSAFKIKTDTHLKGSRQMLSGDVDSDGDIDLLTFAENGSLHFLKNIGGERKNSKIVRLTGRVSNKTGVGAKIDMRSGSLAQKLESYAASPAPAPADIHFGLGRREKPDAVRVIWTSGIIQAEVDFPAPPKGENAALAIKIEELDRKPSSCPYLYAWNGEKFEFISDFLGGGEMAYSFGGGRTNMPDRDEYVRIPASSLKPKDGKYELRVTNELEEVLYLDRFELAAVDHPENTEIYPNEGAGIPTAGKFLLYTTAGEHAPLKAFDGKGLDVLEKVREMDRNFYDTFENENIRGYAKPHELILTLDNRSGFQGRTLLLLTGWTDYAFSSDNVAAAQSGLSLNPPKLQVKNERGEWETVIESIGFSVGRPQTVVVDLTGKFLSKSREVRILTNMKTLWDKIAVDTSGNISQNLTVSKLDAQTADLRERGFSLEVKPDGKEPILVDYDTVLSDGRWKYFSGDFTRTGNVLPLLEQADDVFIISKTGDELALSFSEKKFPSLKKGFKRTFLLYAVGYSKEMDINSASPDAVHPLPFGAMTRYPYGANERFPMTLEMQKIYDEYTTRSVRTVFPRIEAALIK